MSAWKIVLIVFGSFFALLVIALWFAVQYTLPRVGREAIRNSGDPKHIAEVRKAFPELVLPRGYFIGAALDMGLNKTLSIVSLEHRHFSITVTSTPAFGSNPANVQSGSAAGMRIAAKFLCDRYTERPADIVHSNYGDVTVVRSTCERRKHVLESADAAVALPLKLLQFRASGSKADFDEAALRSTIASLKRP